MQERPLRVSRAPAGGIWEEYRLYSRHLELDTVLGTLVVPFDSIDRVTRLGAGAGQGEAEIVIIDRTSGAFRRLLIRPTAGFGNTLEEALGLFRQDLNDH